MSEDGGINTGRSLRAMIAESRVAAIISNPRLPDNPIVACNTAFLELTGYEREEVLGRNCRFLAGSLTEKGLSDAIRTGVDERRPVMVEILNYKKDGTLFRNAVLVAPIFDDNGDLAYFLGSQMELAMDEGPSRADRQAEARMAMDLLSPRQKEVLIAMAAGQLNKQIAFGLGITERTVKMHRAALLQTLGIKTSAEAIRIAIEAGY